MQSREARCWPVLAAWAVVPLDELQTMLVDAETVRPAADAAMRARVASDVRSPRSAARAHTQSPPHHAPQTPRLVTLPLATPCLCCAAGGYHDGQRRGDQPAAATALRRGQDVRPRGDSISTAFYNYMFVFVVTVFVVSFRRGKSLNMRHGLAQRTDAAQRALTLVDRRYIYIYIYIKGVVPRDGEQLCECKGVTRNSAAAAALTAAPVLPNAVALLRVRVSER